MPLQMIFEASSSDRPVPRLPRESDGSPREADGVKYLNLVQAAKRFDVSDGELRRLYLDTFQDLLPSDDAASLAAPLAATAQDLADAAPPVPAIDRHKDDLLRVVVYEHLSDSEFGYFMEVCRRRKLDPWSRQLMAEVRPDPRDPRRRVVNLITSIEAFRVIADRTCQYAGQEGPYWCGPDGAWRDAWLEETPPVAARVGILRHSFAKPVWGFARFKAYAQYLVNSKGEASLGEIWAKMPDLMTAKCAEANALRKAFPDHLGGLYTRDEMMQSDNPRPREPESRREVESPGPAYDGGDGLPTTQRQFELALLDLGFSKPAQRAALIQRFRGKHPHLLEARPEAFYAKVITAVVEDPAAFGADAPVTA